MIPGELFQAPDPLGGFTERGAVCLEKASQVIKGVFIPHFLPGEPLAEKV